MASTRMKFILPDWDDIVDPHYDFVRESRSDDYRKDRYTYGARIWHLFEDPPLDGVLISRPLIEKRVDDIIGIGGIKSFLRIPTYLMNRIQVIADCGAWQYRYRDLPPYDPVETLDFYQKLGVDYGVSVDHIASYGNREERVRITYEYAVKSFDVWKRRYEKGDYTFILLAAVQGIEVSDYVKFVDKLYRIGVRHFALGGLGPRDSIFVSRVVRELSKAFKHLRDVEKVHILGVARPSLIKLYAKLTEFVNEVSFDNATYLRMAWMRHKDNYITIDGKAYTAIRIRKGTPEEHEVIDALRKYDNGELSYEKVLKVVAEYAIRIGDSELIPFYAKTLKDAPWKKCPCPICRSIGIDVVIFRGNDRNRRRGFHNLYVFYTLFRRGLLESIDKFEIQRERDLYITISTLLEDYNPLVEVLASRVGNVERILVITHCTAEKSVDMDEVYRRLKNHNLPVPSFDLENEDTYRRILLDFVKPAIEMYRGTFEAVKNLVNSLRKCGKEVDLYIVSSRYGLINENTLIIPYDATLKSLDPVRLRKWSEQRGIDAKLRTVLSKKYDLIIVILPKEYYKAVKNALVDLLYRKNVIMIVPTASISKMKSVKALILPGGSIRRRLKSIKLLREALLKYLGCRA